MSDRPTTTQSKQRQPWTFEQSNADPGARQVRALEYIAMYLDGIDASLAQIAGEVSPKQSGGDGRQLTEGLAFQLQALVKSSRDSG